MKHLKLFEDTAQYDAFKNSDAFVLPNVSHITNQRQTLYHALKKEKPIVLKAKYNAVDDGNFGMYCYCYNDGNIKSIKIDGNTAQFDPEVNHNSNFEINAGNTAIDWDEWIATCPDEYLINGKIKSWTIKPKDSSIVLTQEAFDNEDIVCGYVYKYDDEDTKYIDYNIICTEDIFNEDGSQAYVKEWDFDVASNSLSLSETAINEGWWSEYNCNFTLLKFNYDTEQFEIIDTVNEVEYITGGLPLYDYMFETEGYHEIEFTLKENYIGNCLFQGCLFLTEITIPNSVTSIGEWAFNSCNGLTSITCLAPTAPNIQSNTFSYIKNGSTLYIPSGSDYSSWMSTDEYYLGYYGWNIKYIVEWPDNFESDHLACLYYVTDISQETNILNNYGLANISSMIVDGVEMDVDCYYQFDTVGAHIVEFVLDDKTLLTERTFSGCKDLTSINIPDSVTTISDYVFYDCKDLTSINIPNSVTTIGRSAFLACTGLTSINIPDSVTTIGDDADSAFDGCSGLTSIVVSDGNKVYDSRENCNCIIETATNKLVQGCQNSFIPYSVTSIGNNAFSYCTGLTSIVIPDSVTSIGNNAFFYCTGLNKITCLAPTAPMIHSDTTFNGIKNGGILKVPAGSDYSSWMSTVIGRKYNWTVQEF